MKKLFRFQYESCSGTCYHPGEEFFQELRKINSVKLNTTIDKIVKAHDSTCDDPTQRFGIDFCEDTKVYIGNFLNGTRLDLFTDKNFINVVDKLIEFVLETNKSKEAKLGDCIYGQTGQENLAEMILNSI